jgi:hypothetical protein
MEVFTLKDDPSHFWDILRFDKALNVLNFTLRPPRTSFDNTTGRGSAFPISQESA